MIQYSNTYHKLPAHFYSHSEADTFPNATLIEFNDELAKQLNINIPVDKLASYFSGQIKHEGLTPISQAYSGHQFGHFNPHLGDGRAMLLGEVVDKNGKRFDVQLKGSGPTAYSRRGDGYSALGPVIREYLVSEAMFALGVPTTRALCAVATGSEVYREKTLPGGVFTRVASSHIRIGTFEHFASRMDIEALKTLADYVIDRHYPSAKENTNPYLMLIELVANRWAKLVAKWMSLGFIHGVMNTDNMAISGETIDYGPCAFMDNFKFDRVFSFIDKQGRYRYDNQIQIAKWNLSRFASTLLPLIDEDSNKAIEITQSQIEKHFNLYDEAWLNEMALKFGIKEVVSSDKKLITDFLTLLETHDLDFTNSFRAITNNPQALNHYSGIESWSNDWQAHRVDKNLMERTNPEIIPRNHLIEAAIKAAEAGNYQSFREMHEVLKTPFKRLESNSIYKLPPKPEERIKNTFCGT